MVLVIIVKTLYQIIKQDLKREGIEGAHNQPIGETRIIEMLLMQINFVIFRSVLVDAAFTSRRLN